MDFKWPQIISSSSHLEVKSLSSLFVWAGAMWFDLMELESPQSSCFFHFEGFCFQVKKPGMKDHI